MELLEARRINHGWYNRNHSDSFPISDYYYSKYEEFPSNLSINDNQCVRKEFLKWLFGKFEDLKIVHTHFNVEKNKERVHSFVLEIPSRQIIFRCWPRDHLKAIGESNIWINVFFHDREANEDIIEALKSYSFTVKKGKENNISLIIQNGDSLNTEEFPVKIGPLDIALNYGVDFLPVYNKIVKRLNTKDDKGIVMLHGCPGTGKTSLLKYLCTKIKKEILFVPPSMAESIISPRFIPFLMQHSNCILVIEDAEKILMDRQGQYGNQAVSNMLNISDGILGDCLNIQIIATFNTDLKNIDTALLRKGRLIAEHEFRALPKSDANNLLKHLGKNHVATGEMTLTDIYNIDEEEFKKQEKRRPVGFNTSK